MKIVLNKTRLIFNIGIAIFYSMMVTLPLVAAQELLPMPVQLKKSAQAGDKEHVRRALSESAQANQTSSYGWTPLSLASGHGHTDIVNMLIKAHANNSKLGDIKPEMKADIETGEVEQEKAIQEKAKEIMQAMINILNELEQVAHISAKLAHEAKKETNS